MMKWLAVLAVLLLVICVVGGCSARLVSDYTNAEFERLAYKHGFAPSHEGLSKYIRSIVKVGMSSEEVENSLKQLGPVTVKQGQTQKEVLPNDRARCDVISLGLNALSIWNLDMWACYDSKDHLLFLTAMDPEVYPDLEIGQ
jgi:hypothetical protein